ncbi:uncharacterized protein LOC120009492 [Tripterygium wilfordii]|uniref:uncharacterized protein LOC120009492 n=1 Tax=Tripterygium wilfordii TaxID=458696 RepID=UPI0018F80C80|nr:uncharacterized protein LOC120009492 [Tripterygium wilfordii]
MARRARIANYQPHQSSAPPPSQQLNHGLMVPLPIGSKQIGTTGFTVLFTLSGPESRELPPFAVFIYDDDSNGLNGIAATINLWSPSNDSYQRACYNMDCGGFVMESNDILGSALEPTSSYDGEQKDIIVEIWKDIELRRWRLKYKDIMVGYWPEDLFTHLRTGGTEAEWGGKVLNTNHNNIFTSTKMGSGRFADEGYGKASYFKNQKVKTSSSGHNWIPPPTLRREVSDSRYYTILAEADIDEFGNSGFFYGGPGNNNTS